MRRIVHHLENMNSNWFIPIFVILVIFLNGLSIMNFNFNSLTTKQEVFEFSEENSEGKTKLKFFTRKRTSPNNAGRHSVQDSITLTHEEVKEVLDIVKQEQEKEVILTNKSKMQTKSKKNKTKKVPKSDAKVVVANEPPQPVVQPIPDEPEVAYAPIMPPKIPVDASNCEFNNKDVKRLKQNFSHNSSQSRIDNCRNYLDSLYKIIYAQSNNTYERFPKYPTTMTTKLAFIYVVHQQVSLFEILLHLTFRPYNAYCIYVGSNTKAIITNTITKLIDCYKEMYPNTSIFMAKGTSEVKWGRFSLLEADLHCLRDLMKIPNWNYALNLAGSELPLYSVDELSERLSVQTDLKVSTVSYFDRRFEIRHKFKWGNRALGRKGPVPFKLKIFKGYKNAILRRDFVKFVLNHEVSQALTFFLRDTSIPDEHLYATLGRIESITETSKPGATKKTYQVKQSTPGKSLSDPQGLCQRITLWDHKNFFSANPIKKCQGKFIRQICHLSLKDLKEIDDRNRLNNGKPNCYVANKFDVNIDPRSIICIARRVYHQDYEREKLRLLNNSTISK